MANYSNHNLYNLILVEFFFILSGWAKMIPCGTYGLLFHKHLSPKHFIPIVGYREGGVKEVGKNYIGLLDKSSKDECTHAWYIQKHVCNHITSSFPMAMVNLNSEKMC